MPADLRDLRPRSIILFDWFYLSSRIISVLPALYGVMFPPADAKPSADDPNVILYLIVILAFPIALTILWFFTSVKGSNIGRWLTTAVVAYEAFATAYNWRYYMSEEVQYLWLLALVVMLDIAAAIMLHRRNSREWFKAFRRFGKPDPSVFD